MTKGYVILINGVARTFRDRRDIAFEAARFFKSKAKGEIIDYRANTTPQALLGVRLVSAPYRAPDHDGHSWDVVQPTRRR